MLAVRTEEAPSTTMGLSWTMQTLIDAESAAGLDDDQVWPRVQEPEFRYRGSGDPHWCGQPCFLCREQTAGPDERIVTMACGCRASVPGSTLQPYRPAR
jgi:hypothetical protein